MAFATAYADKDEQWGRSVIFSDENFWVGFYYIWNGFIYIILHINIFIYSHAC